MGKMQWYLHSSGEVVPIGDARTIEYDSNATNEQQTKWAPFSVARAYVHSLGLRSQVVLTTYPHPEEYK